MPFGPVSRFHFCQLILHFCVHGHICIVSFNCCMQMTTKEQRSVTIITFEGQYYVIHHIGASGIQQPPHHAQMQLSLDTQEDIDWTSFTQSYPIHEAQSFISQQRQAAGQHVFTTTANPTNLQGKQLHVYTIVQQHHIAKSPHL